MRRLVTICKCTHPKREHWGTKQRPNGACRSCACRAFTPEPICRCGHGLKAHAKGPCHQTYIDGCKAFRERGKNDE
jgi:hypothetical protein